MHLQPVAVGSEPVPNAGILVIRGIVLNQNGSTAAVVEGQLMEECQVRGSIENGILLVMEAGLPEFDGAKDLDALTLAGDRDLRRPADPTPGGVQRGVLPEARFVGEDQRPVFSLGFFLRLGYVCRCQRSCWRASARASRRRGRCTEKPRPWRNLRTCPGW